MAKKVSSLRERQKAATRRELSGFGIELILRQGFSDTTIEQIVEPLGISKRTFFRYFKTKEDLIFAWHEDKTAELVAELKGRPERERPYTAVCETLASLLNRYDAHPDLAYSMLTLLKETPSLIGRDLEKRMRWERALAAALVEREGSKAMTAIKARIIVGTVMTAWTAALDEWYDGGGTAKLRPIVKKAFSLAGKR